MNNNLLLTDFSLAELLKTHRNVLNELRSRGVVRSENNPTGDLCEYIFCKALGWEQQPNSVKGFDAIDTHGIKYQIKGRRLTPKSRSRQLSAIRDLDAFDFLAGLLLDEYYQIIRAALIPRDIVRKFSKYTEHTNSYRFLLVDELWDLKEVQNVTIDLRNFIL